MFDLENFLASSSVIDFVVISGKEENNPANLIKQWQTEYDNQVTIKSINIKPHIPETETEFERVELYIKAAIFNQLKWRKLKSAKEVTIENILKWEEEFGINILIISWFSDKITTLRHLEILRSFLEKYHSLNAALATTPKLLFCFIFSYIQGSSITEEQLCQYIESLELNLNIPKFIKV